MYHLVKRLSGAIAALLLVLASGGALHALPISGFIADQTTSHAGADIVVGLVPSFVYAPGPGPTGLYSFTATPIGGDPVVTVTVVGDDLYINPINGTSGRADIRVVATDASGSLGIEFRVEVTNDAPTLSSIGNQSLAEGSALSFSAVASDADGTGEILTFSLDPGAPSGASIDPSTGAFSWTPSEAQGPDSYTVTIRVTDAVGESDAATFDVDVDEVNQAPVLGPIGDQTIDEESLLTFVAAAADADVPANALTYSLDGGAPPGALIDPISGVFSWTPAEADSPGSFTITVRASDDGTPSLDATETITITVVEVNDAPSLIPGGDVPDQFMDEDDPTLNVEVRSQFDDADLVDTPPDTLTVIVLPGYDAGLVSVVPNASGVEITPLADQHGTTTVTVGVEDGAGSSATDTFLLTVNPVNDDPSVVNPIADINTLEDDPTTFTIDLSTVFADPDVATDGDSLSFSMTNSNSGLFDVNSLSGSVLSLHLRPDQYGTAVITVRATDSLGQVATDTFNVNVASVNDMPIAAADAVGPFNEDPGLIVIPVLNNDYLAEQPTVIGSAGIGGYSESPPTIVLNAFDDPVAEPNGTVTIVGNNIHYQPKDNFFGTDYFTYTLVDSDGDVSAPATVTIQINQVNDPPEGVQLRTFTMFENQTLTVSEAEGVFTGSYDVDGALLDGSGNPVGSALSAVLTVPPPLGSLDFDNVTGSFRFIPPINFVGEISFFYRLFDGLSVSSGTDYEVRVVINATPAAPLPPAPGTVAITYNISNIPLEQTTNVAPNVLVVMDDSGSMDWNLIVAGLDEQGGFTLNNSPRASRGRYATSYVYLWDLRTNAYPSSSDSGRILPTEEALNAHPAMAGNAYGVWRARNHLYNSIYYNPTIMYRPWIGQDINNNEFTDADPAAIRLEPRDPSNTIDILSAHTYRATNVPEWDNNGGRTTVDIDGAQSLYIPRYYTTTADAPLAWNDPHTLVEIRPANGPWPAANGREDCAGDGDPTTCSYAEEIQNFANWFQYYRSREYVTKASIGRVVSEVQDIRLGYETISNTGSEEVRLMNQLYTEGNKKLLLDNIYDVDSYGGTPLRQALGRAGQIFACQTGNYCPALPAPDGSCQQNFALLFSDGYWNGGAGVTGNVDTDGFGPFDGGRYADSVSATLADVAMYYYETDIQPTLENDVPLSRMDVDGAPPGTFDATNNTMHQHMKTYSIAFGVNGTIDPASVPLNATTPFAWSDPFNGSLEKIDDMLHAAVNGRGRFLNARNPVELQAAFEQAFLEFTQAASSTSAAAFNSTSLRDGTLLYRGFFDLRDNTGELTATIVNTDGTLAPAPSWRASDMLDPPNKLPDNRVLVTSEVLSGDGTPFRYSDLSPEHQLMMSENEVNYVRGERGNENQNGGLLRDRPATNGLLGDIVNSSPVFVGVPRAINRDQAPYPTSELYSSFAADVYARRPVVYVGANDGILHGFSAETGLELFGYLPSKNMDTSELYHNDLEDVASPFYQHKYFVDLTPSLQDTYMRPSRSATSREWMTLMIGGLGAGGKGYFALNVTDPDAQFVGEAAASSAVLWEFTDEDDTYPVDASGNPIAGGALLDPAGRPVKDLGVAMTQPTITMSNVSDGGSPAEREWIAIFGNGLNSTAGIAKLFVLFVDRGLDGWDPGDVIKLDTGFGVPISPALRAGYPNGLGTPSAVDVDLNGTVDWVYAGDRLGNLYRFDLSDPDPGNWTSTRLFTASYTDGGGNTTIQPILGKPLVTKHPTEDGFLISFGTGSHIAREDADLQDIQSVYTIWDRGETNPATAQADTKATRLIEQVMTNVVDDSMSPAQTRRILTSYPVNYVSEGGTPGVYGWYVDFDMPRATSTLSGALNPDVSGLAPPSPQFPGEKAIRRLLFRDGVIIATTVLPSVGTTSCFGSRPGAILLFDVLTGGNPIFSLIDFNNDGYVDDNDLVDVDGQSYSAGLLFDQEALDGSLVDPSILGGEGDTDFLFISGGNETTSFRIRDVSDSRTGRLSWQQLD